VLKGHLKKEGHFPPVFFPNSGLQKFRHVTFTSVVCVLTALDDPAPVDHTQRPALCTEQLSVI